MLNEHLFCKGRYVNKVFDSLIVLHLLATAGHSQLEM
jgi:hypothetical protein